MAEEKVVAYGYSPTYHKLPPHDIVHRKCRRKFESRFTETKDGYGRSWWNGPSMHVIFFDGAQAEGLKTRICTVCKQPFT